MRKLAIVMIFIFLLIASGCNNKLQPELKGSNKNLFEYKKTNTADYEIVDDGAKVFFLTENLCLGYISQSADNFIEIREYTSNKEIPVSTAEVEGDYYLSALGMGTDRPIVLTASDEDYIINVYSNRVKTGTIKVQRDIIETGYPFFACQTESNRFLLMTHSAIYLIDDFGNIIKEKKYDENAIGCANRLSNGTICVTYIKANYDSSIACVDKNSLELLSKTKIESYPTFMGEYDEKCFFSDGQNIYGYNIAECRTEKLYDLQKHYLRRECIQNIYFSEEKMSIIYRDNLDSREKIKVIEFEKSYNKADMSDNQNGCYDEDGKKIIYIYSSNGIDYVRAGLGDAINEFNIDNMDYAVRIMDEQSNIDIAINPDLVPDILCEVQPTTITHYAKIGYLEDLWPYIEQSAVLEKSDFVDALKKIYETDDHLFGITNEISVKGILLTDVGENFKGAWTVEEFIDWLSEHNDVVSVVGLDVPFVCGLSLPGLIADYVDFDSGKANFNNERFIRIIEKIKKLDFEECNSEKYLTDAEVMDASKDRPYLASRTIGSVEDMAAMEAVLGKKLEYIGYPSDSNFARGILSPLFNVAITSDSRCKEGAYEFIEFWLKRERSAFESDMQGTSEELNRRGTISVFSHIYEDNLESGLGEKQKIIKASSGEEVILKYTVTEEYIKNVKEMIEAAEPETFEKYQIKLLMAEELTNYLNGSADAETTAKVIQSRVQLFLDEIK